MSIRGIRGATTVEENSKDTILEETKNLINQILEKNTINKQDIASIFFSVTHDLDSTFPAAAARELNLTYTPLLCLNEIAVKGSLEKCIRILMHVNLETPQENIKHIYLNKAICLRPEFAN
jgi:chorismate mutase